ncbi:hypothetical protein [Fodinibius halophilus]|uniref:DUF4402 domain-containing protein n=1 Tax=Fodinibius halophilus TaxID=1736908 RepID=A0A6M1T1H4_9BACT|nr:hypothetical protein [Fodinibius halophilus]NGP87829.1 hypothetical protein [Fodinibius halophilus]
MTSILNTIKTGSLPFWALLLVLLFPCYSNGQFIDLTLEISPRISAQTEQFLDFGTITTNSGQKTIEFGSPDMGIFSITALENQTLLLQIDMPAELRHNDPSVTDVVPISLFSRYGYSRQNFQESLPLQNEIGNIRVEPNPAPSPWNTLYLFIYGSVNIGNISDGMYSSNISLNVEYI